MAADPKLERLHAVPLFSGSDKKELEQLAQAIDTIDVEAAKALYDRGAVFIDVSNDYNWNQAHIPGAVHLPFIRFKDPERVRFQESTLREVADVDDEIVLHCFDQNCPAPAFAARRRRILRSSVNRCPAPRPRRSAD